MPNHLLTFSLVDLFVGSIGGFGLLGSNEAANPLESLIAHNEGSGDGSLALCDDALLLNLLELARVDLEDVVFTLETLVVREEYQCLGVIVELRSGLLDDWESLVNLVKGLVTQAVGVCDVGREVLIRAGEPGKDGSRKRLVGRVAKLDTPLAVFIGLEAVDAVADYGIIQKVLNKSRGTGAVGDIAVDLGFGHFDCGTMPRDGR
jgi:hypothetical protein